MNNQVTIILNGIFKTVEARPYSYEDLIRMRYEGSAFKPNVLPDIMSIVYDNGPNDNHEGSLKKGDSLVLTEGMILNIHRTDNA